MSLPHRMNWGRDPSDSSDDDSCEEEDRCRRYFGRGGWDSSDEEDTPIKTKPVVVSPIGAAAKPTAN